MLALFGRYRGTKSALSIGRSPCYLTQRESLFPEAPDGLLEGRAEAAFLGTLQQHVERGVDRQEQDGAAGAGGDTEKGKFS